MAVSAESNIEDTDKFEKKVFFNNLHNLFIIFINEDIKKIYY